MCACDSQIAGWLVTSLFGMRRGHFKSSSAWRRKQGPRPYLRISQPHEVAQTFPTRCKCRGRSDQSIVRYRLMSVYGPLLQIVRNICGPICSRNSAWTIVITHSPLLTSAPSSNPHPPAPPLAPPPAPPTFVTPPSSPATPADSPPPHAPPPAQSKAARHQWLSRIDHQAIIEFVLCTTSHSKHRAGRENRAASGACQSGSPHCAYAALRHADS